jgi:hypothetical protein
MGIVRCDATVPGGERPAEYSRSQEKPQQYLSVPFVSSSPMQRFAVSIQGVPPMKKFLPTAGLPLLVLPMFLLNGCTTTKSSAPAETVATEVVSADTTSDTSAGDSTLAVAGDSLDSVASANSTDSIASGSAETTIASDSASADSVTTDSTPAAESVPADTGPTQAVSNVSIQPGQSTDKFVGAVADVTTDVCKSDGAGWTISGKVKNASGSAANYRIYVALNRKGTTDTRALLQVDKSVADGKTEPWETKAAVTDSDLVCIMRVERTPAK